MPTNFDDHVTGGPSLVFADDLEGTEFKLTEAAVYASDEVPPEESEMPKFGNWLRVETEHGEEWLVAVSELVGELKRFENPAGSKYRVTRCEKSGPRDTDPYEVNLTRVEASDQTRL